MIITDSSIGMDSSRKYTSVSTDAYVHTKSTNVWSANDFIKEFGNAYAKSGKALAEPEKTESEGDSSADTLSGGMDGSLEYLKGKFNEITSAKVASVTRKEDDLRTAIRFMCLNFLLLLLIGNGNRKDAEDLFERAFSKNGKAGLGDLSGAGAAMGLGSLAFRETTETVERMHYGGEFEETSFDAKGIVKTADGRELDFNIGLTMSRSFEEYTKETGSYSTFEAMLMDPLVINLDTCAAEVSDQKFYFDLDADGTEDEVAMLSKGSGFLALDINGDGEINDGSELFGTKSGDGFKDLAKYDKDGNGWIDEADEVFDRLKIFCINEDGTSTQYSLKDKGVGAIYLGNANTQFSVTNAENNVNAMIRKTGLFLYESGSAGTVQHVDLKVELGA